MRRGKRRRRTSAVFPLKQVLERYGWSQRKLSRATGLDYNRVNDLANGRHLPNWQTVLRIVTAIGADLGDFVPHPEGASAPPVETKPASRPRAGGKLVPVTAKG